MANIEPVQVATGRSAQNHPITVTVSSIIDTPQLTSVEATPNLTEGQDFPSGNAGLEN